MSKITPTKPVLIMLYGYPGSGKTHFARQFCDSFQAAHVQGDRIRHELFEEPRYDKQENEVIAHLMDYMAEEFLDAGISVVYDTNAMRLAQRRTLRDMARKSKAQHLLVWFQIDPDSAFARTAARDRRRSDDRYAMPIDKATFERVTNQMQNPRDEEYTVISGKHAFAMQQSTIMKRLYDMGIISSGTAVSQIIKPGLVNLVPNPMAGRVDNTRRNIVIR